MSRINIQDQLLYQARKEKCPVKIFLLKGLQLHGKIAAYDMYSVLLESQGRLQLIFKHAISTIDFPEKIRLSFDGGQKKLPKKNEEPADTRGDERGVVPGTGGSRGVERNHGHSNETEPGTA